MKRILLFAASLASAAAWGQAPLPEASVRADGRAVNARTVAQLLMEHRPPALAFDPGFSAGEFVRWREEVRREMAALMRHPDAGVRPEPRQLGAEARDGYRIEKWEGYPIDGCAVRFLVLVPDGASEASPRPAVLCIPGSGQTKELLAGEQPLAPAHGAPGPVVRDDMARQFVRAGLIAVAVDNPCAGETCDLESLASAPRGYDYDDTSRMLLELGWSYQGYTSFVDKYVLDWMKRRPAVRRDRIVVSGFSLGTETLMALGALDDEIFAFVYNDFLCRTRERLLSMTLPGADGRRHFPNSIRHLIPGMLVQFDFPDLVAALAPRPVICTEGGMDRDFRLVERAYAVAGNPEGCRCLHQPRFAEASAREAVDRLPHGLTREEFFRLACVDPANHYFKGEVIVPWLLERLEAGH